MGKQKQRRGQGVSGNPSRRSGATRGAGPAKQAFPGMFDLAEELMMAAQASAAATTSGPTLTRFDVGQLVRAINAVKAGALLLEHSHWEFASGVARQLFEQLVNMEYLAAQPDRLVAATSYTKFGLMQQIAQRLREVEYEERTGRPADPAFRDLLRGWLDLNFDEFKGKPKHGGGLNLKTSWTGKNVAQLTESSRNAMRANQYDLLFRVWSTEVHASPAAMIDGLFGSGNKTIEEVMQDDREQVAQLLSTVLNLFIDLWKVLPNVKQPGLGQTLEWLARLRAELGKVLDLSGYTPPSNA